MFWRRGWWVVFVWFGVFLLLFLKRYNTNSPAQKHTALECPTLL